MTLSIRLFPALSDNYGLLIRDEATGMVAAIDTPDADAIEADLAASGWDRLDLILNTHWHADHTQGNATLAERWGAPIVAPAEVERLSRIDRVIADGDTVEVGDTPLTVLAAPGHTLGHIVYVGAGQAFVGDVMFVLGCGRLFEGTPEQMFDSLTRLAALPDDTVVWCAHEYTAGNARFTLSVDDRPETAAHVGGLLAMRDRGEPTVPTTIGAQKAFNPFVRARDAADFARLRAAKDAFQG